MSLDSLPSFHPRTGARLRPVGHRKNGAPIWPILGGSEPPNQPDISTRPDGVPQEEWDALADPGKRALVRERTARTEAETARTTERQAREAAERALAEAKAAGEKTNPPKPGPPAKPGDISDVDARIQAGIEAAMKPYREREEQREAEQAARGIRDAVAAAAAERFHDPVDAISQIDLTTLTDGQGQVDNQKVKSALDGLLEKKPYLGKAVDTRRRAPDGSLIGGGGRPAATKEERVKAALALMADGK